jgi:molybdate transport system ATP-binding protein
MGDSRLVLDFEKRFPTFQLQIDLEIRSETLVLFGPSGAGKTQTLTTIAGLTHPDRGEITLDGRPLFRDRATERPINLPARQRQVAMVFQQYALFPHLTARENVEFPMRPASKSRALALLARVQLESYADRYPHQLSGGQQQRVAIARALAAQARALLLDEPFSALDRPVRDALHQDLRTLQEETGLIIVYVTHNLEDALAVGDRLALIDHGRIVQVASPGSIYAEPRNRTVLEILGVPNLFDGPCRAGQLDWKGLSLQLPRLAVGSAAIGSATERPISGYLPAEEVHLVERCPSDSVPNVFPCLVRRVLPSGRASRVLLELPNGCSIEALLPSATCPPRAGTSLFVSLPPDAFILTTGP